MSDEYLRWRVDPIEKPIIGGTLGEVHVVTDGVSTYAVKWDTAHSELGQKSLLVEDSLLTYLSARSFPVVCPEYVDVREGRFDRWYPYVSVVAYDQANPIHRKAVAELIGDYLALSLAYHVSDAEALVWKKRWWCIPEIDTPVSMQEYAPLLVEKLPGVDLRILLEGMYVHLVTRSQCGSLRMGIVHADFKSPHFLFSPEGTVEHVLDFGTAHWDVLLYDLWRPFLDLYTTAGMRREFLQIVDSRFHFTPDEKRALPYVGFAIAYRETAFTLAHRDRYGDSFNRILDKRLYQLQIAIDIIPELEKDLL
jgi:hypothetical protein